MTSKQPPVEPSVEPPRCLCCKGRAWQAPHGGWYCEHCPDRCARDGSCEPHTVAPRPMHERMRKMRVTNV